MMMLILGCVLFFGVHSVHFVAPAAREAGLRRLGKKKWMALYSVIAGIGLVMIIIGYGAARQDPSPVYVPPAWGRSAAGVLMLPVFPLLLATYMPGRIQQFVRHPMLWATILWAAAHLLANGNWADIVLFGAFLVWAILDLLSFLYRPAKDIPRLPPKRWIDAIAVIGGLVIYGLFLVAIHRWLTGIPLIY